MIAIYILQIENLGLTLLYVVLLFRCNLCTNTYVLTCNHCVLCIFLKITLAFLIYYTVCSRSNTLDRRFALEKNIRKKRGKKFKAL